MTVRQDRYVDPDTSVIRVKESDVIEAPKIPDNPTLRASDVQQTVNNSTLPVSSRAVKLIIDGYATENYVDQKFNSIDLSSYASITYVDGEIEAVDTKIASTNGSIAEAQERADSAYSLADSKADKAYVNSKVDSIDLSVYALKSDLSSYLTTEDAGLLATKEELKSYATKQYVDGELILKADKSQLEGLATKAWVEERLSEFMTEVREEIEKSKNEEPADGGV